MKKMTNNIQLKKYQHVTNFLFVLVCRSFQLSELIVLSFTKVRKTLNFCPLEVLLKHLYK